MDALRPLADVGSYIRSVEASLMPMAMGELLDRLPARPERDEAARRRLLDAVRLVDTEAELRAILYRASPRRWRALRQAMERSCRLLLDAEAPYPEEIRRWVGEYLANRSPLNVVRLALRGPE